MNLLEATASVEEYMVFRGYDVPEFLTIQRQVAALWIEPGNKTRFELFTFEDVVLAGETIRRGGVSGSGFEEVLWEYEEVVK